MNHNPTFTQCFSGPILLIGIVHKSQFTSDFSVVYLNKANKQVCPENLRNKHESVLRQRRRQLKDFWPERRWGTWGTRLTCHLSTDWKITPEGVCSFSSTIAKISKTSSNHLGRGYLSEPFRQMRNYLPEPFRQTRSYLPEPQQQYIYTFPLSNHKKAYLLYHFQLEDQNNEKISTQQLTFLKVNPQISC